MKLSKKLSIVDNGNNIVAIIDTNGKILSGTKEVSNLLKFLMETPLTPAPFEKGEKVGTKFVKANNMNSLITVLENELPDFGYKLSHTL